MKQDEEKNMGEWMAIGSAAGFALGVLSGGDFTWRVVPMIVGLLMGTLIDALLEERRLAGVTVAGGDAEES